MSAAMDRDTKRASGAPKLTPNRLAYLKAIVEHGSIIRARGIGVSSSHEWIPNSSIRVVSGTAHALEKAGLIHCAKHDWRSATFRPTEAGRAAAAVELPAGYIMPWEARAQKREERSRAWRESWARDAERVAAKDGVLKIAVAYFDQKASHDDLEAAVARYRKSCPEATDG